VKWGERAGKFVLLLGGSGKKKKLPGLVRGEGGPNSTEKPAKKLKNVGEKKPDPPTLKRKKTVYLEFRQGPQKKEKKGRAKSWKPLNAKNQQGYWRFEREEKKRHGVGPHEKWTPEENNGTYLPSDDWGSRFRKKKKKKKKEVKNKWGGVSIQEKKFGKKKKNPKSTISENSSIKSV